ncbi:hypothetical protein [Marinitenerispora sediminis]|uniref:Uncharacterized protein n=1 Tax=Marinitenerispora sediminis TaxID=1931232 RepID=A0A368T2D2_9ACTN|nr:hypothetical protein [Marinitenerispora sediminis]RCV48885.1 hypothetical protein DEF28_22330 [Marinitenerispora sediminis]RCV51335.1 hypothetical protein DEF23_20615 [Marinitenerispora sediminis]RCV54922.1 hypothetical protein DEF24_18635 [Marinitenerispora sediminis]
MATSALLVPVYALDLARRHGAVLLCVYAAGTLLHELLIRLMVWLNGVDRVAALAGLSVSILVTLTTTILMFHLLRPALPTLDAELLPPRRRANAPGGFAERERRVVDAVAMAILPFLLFYSAWGLFVEEFREYSITVGNTHGILGFEGLTDVDAMGLPMAVALASLAGRVLLEKLYARSRNVWLGVLTALFEANWMFFAVFSVSQLTGDAAAWVGDRVVVAEMRGAGEDALGWLAAATSLPLDSGFAAVVRGAGELWPHLKEGLVEPLLWLTIVAVVFGAEIDRAEALFRRGGRAERVRRAAARLPELVRGVGRFAGRDLREKYTPFLNAFRFILRVSPVFYLSFCLYYGVLELGFAWLERGVYRLVGPHEFLAWWWQWLGPIDFAVSALHEILRVCLLAATFEVTLRRLGQHSVGRRARRAVPGPPERAGAGAPSA